ncbi:hypothetical protein DL98DRAFT_507700 [Cadophora sp. DSE1049]|nr:hypothetical protein DL98DRAFT_507700 [Cadophora sp. DSE1049]
MAPIRSSNLERSKWRSKCREELSKHIQKKVGILIEPSQVRLVTGADDLYTWKVLPHKKHLFSKNISDHSIGAYKELCEGIDSAFEAVPVATTTQTRSAEHPPQASFSAKIDELREENENLERELKQWKDQATAESKLRQESEQERNQLRDANQTLQCELQKSVMAAEYFRSSISQYSQMVARIMPLMGELRNGLDLDGVSDFGTWHIHPDVTDDVGQEKVMYRNDGEN